MLRRSRGLPAAHLCLSPESARQLWPLQPGSSRPGSRAAPLGTRLWWSSQSLGPVLLTVAAPAGEQRRQRLPLSRCPGGHAAPSLVLPWSEQLPRPGLQETWQGCEPARWENAAAAGRWRAAVSMWRARVCTPLPREGASHVYSVQGSPS